MALLGESSTLPASQPASHPVLLVASRVAQGVSGPSSSCVWNPRVFADDARGWLLNHFSRVQLSVTP